jgi:hypothetical protein
LISERHRVAQPSRLRTSFRKLGQYRSPNLGRDQEWAKSSPLPARPPFRGAESKIGPSRRTCDQCSAEFVWLGLLDYVKALPEGPLFPGLTRRKSKGNKVGARVGELFRNKLASPEVKAACASTHSAATISPHRVAVSSALNGIAAARTTWSRSRARVNHHMSLYQHA